MSLPTSARHPHGPYPSWTFGWAFQTSGWAFQLLPDIQMGLPTSPGPSDEPPDPSQTCRRASQPFLALRVGHQTIPDLRVGLPTPPGPPNGQFGPPAGPTNTYQPANRATQTFPNLWAVLPDLWVGLPTLPGTPSGSLVPSWTFGWDSWPLQDLRVVLPTPAGPLGGTPD